LPADENAGGNGEVIGRRPSASGVAPAALANTIVASEVAHRTATAEILAEAFKVPAERLFDGIP